MMDRKKMVGQFQMLEELLRNDCKKMSEESYNFNIGMLAAFGLALDSRQNRYSRRYADIKYDCDAIRRGDNNA